MQFVPDVSVEDNEESQQPFVLDDWDSWMSADD